jgi:uncharacterized protein YndB with AHSA1/START domain
MSRKARNDVLVKAPPSRVWAVLADGHTYPDWVVGSAESRKVEPDFPKPGATLHHTQIVPKIGLRDTSTVLEAEEPHHMLLEVRVRPFIVSKVEFELAPEGDGTRVTMWEWGEGGILPRLTGPFMELSLKIRNAETLRRLRNVAERN